MPERVLVVDDDSQILRAVATSLRARGIEALTASDGETGLQVLSDNEVDLLILDLGLPGMDGHEIIKRLRNWSTVPVIVLSVREAQQEKIEALDAGADDYVVKPFAMEELLARMRAVGRRSDAPNSAPILRFGYLELDLIRQLVTKESAPLHLTPTEYRLLEAMATHPGKLLTHAWLLQRVWGPHYGQESQYLRVFVRQLRQKLGDDPANGKFIVTEPGLGYRWKAEPEEL
ncbi:MAG: response regulator transcription factor [Actinobacteria bacterium]|nr:response regulator transcription factor [Actinomycetota bacterium]